MSLFIPITKVDIARQLVYGTLSEEVPDKAGEILDYESAKPAFIEWSNQLRDASGGKSLGNVRAMHGAVAAGKLTDLQFDDDARRISGVAKIVDDDEWKKVTEGVYTGFSIGGGYARRWPDAQNPELMRYTPTLSEVSLVDNPAVPTATFEVIKRDGTTELRKFTRFIQGDAMSKINTASDADEYDTRMEHLLEELSWLAQEAHDSGDDELLEQVQNLQDCLENDSGENDGSDDDMQEEDSEDSDNEDADMDDDDTTSQAYAGELARFQRSARRDRTARKMIAKSWQVSRELEAMQKRIALLEAFPLPAKGSLHLVSKSDDRKTLQQTIDTLPPEQRVRELMKMALSHPVEV